MKVVLHPAELRAPGEQEDRPDDHHADLVQHGLGRGRQILGHTHSYRKGSIFSQNINSFIRTCIVVERNGDHVDHGPPKQPTLLPIKYHLESINCILHPKEYVQICTTCDGAKLKMNKFATSHLGPEIFLPEFRSWVLL